MTLLYVGLGQEDRSVGETALDRARELLAGIEVQILHRQGRVTGRLVAESRDQGFDLVILEMRQIGHLRRILTGSRIRSLIRRGNTSVLIAKQPRERLERILVCTSGTQIAEGVVEMGVRLARRAGAQVTLLHVAGAVPSMYTGLDEIEETLSELLDSDTPIARHLRWGAEHMARNQVRGELELRHGVVADEVLREASSGDYDLIVLGAPRPRGMLVAWLLGDVGWNVVARASCPVLVVKPGGGAVQNAAIQSNEFPSPPPDSVQPT